MYLTVETLSSAAQNVPEVAEALYKLEKSQGGQDLFQAYLKEGTEDEIDSDRLVDDLVKSLQLTDDSDSNVHQSYYQILLKTYFPKDYKFLTIDEVKINPELTIRDAAEQLNTLAKNSADRVDDLMTMLSNVVEQRNNTDLASVFSRIKDGKVIVDKQAIADHLKFIEMSRTITAKQVLENPYEIGIKIISYYLETHQSFFKKT